MLLLIKIHIYYVQCNKIVLFFRSSNEILLVPNIQATIMKAFRSPIASITSNLFLCGVGCLNTENLQNKGKACFEG